MKTRDALGLLVGLLWLSVLALHLWAGVGFFVVLFSHGSDADPPDWALYGCGLAFLRMGLDWFLPERWKGWPLD